jgi:hypothetical protein
MEPQAKKKYLAIGIAVVGVLVLVFSLTRTGDSADSVADESGLPQETYWQCEKPGCKNTFTLSRADLIKHQDANPQSPMPPCPKCKQSDVAAANKCPHCGHIYAAGGRGRTVCPKCNKPPTPA